MGKHEKVSHMGMDCHKNFSRVTARDRQGKVVWRQRIEHGDREAMRQELKQWPKVPVVLEGTFGWGWISDELAQAGQEPHLSSSRKVAAWRDARGIAKSNKLDADLLSELWPQQPRWWEVWLAPPEVRDQREWLRYRTTLVRMQTGIKNRIHATFHRHGIFFQESDLFGTAGLKLLQALIDAGDATLRDSAKKTLEGYLTVLKTLRRQIAEVTRQLRRQVRKSVEGELWRSLPGFSWVLSYTIAAEVGQIRRFKSNQNLASYSLLAAIACDSGEESEGTPIGRHVGHIGRVTLKWAFIAAARNAVRKDPQFKAVFDRRTDSGKRDKGRGYIAVARHLCRIGFSCVSKQRPYRSQRPLRPGTTTAATAEVTATAKGKDKESLKEKNNALTDNACTSDSTSRPGMGQSDRSLVAAGL